MTEHRVPMLGAGLRRRVDPARSRDPRVRELVAALSGLQVAPAPRPEFRAELRAQLVAVAPRLVAEGEAGLVPAARAGGTPAAAPTAAKPDKHRTRGFRLAKPLIAAACVLTAFVLLLGGAVLLSRHALPGDTLYGLKRASENTEYSLAGGAVDKGKLKLEFAARRIGEARDLLPGSSGTISSDTASLVRSTLASANGDIHTAAKLLDTSAVHNRNAGTLNAISSWTPGQVAAMQAVLARMPAGALRGQAVDVVRLLQRAHTRALALQQTIGCACLGSSGSDDLGPLPCTGPCASRTVTPPPAKTPPGTSGPGAGTSSGGRLQA
ncbi:MAG: DUF5667 domain-containing protein, partial [Jatrophihabitantaceae bacterium]